MIMGLNECSPLSLEFQLPKKSALQMVELTFVLALHSEANKQEQKKTFSRVPIENAFSYLKITDIHLLSISLMLHLLYRLESQLPRDCYSHWLGLCLLHPLLELLWVWVQWEWWQIQCFWGSSLHQNIELSTNCHNIQNLILVLICSQIKIMDGRNLTLLNGEIHDYVEVLILIRFIVNKHVLVNLQLMQRYNGQRDWIK